MENYGDTYETERKYWAWLEEHHPEEFRRRLDDGDARREYAEELRRLYKAPVFDPYVAFEPSVASIKETIKALNAEAYRLLQEQQVYKRSSFLSGLLPANKREHDRILNRIKQIQYRVAERERTGSWVLGVSPNAITDEDKRLAKGVPITDFLVGRIRRSGKRVYTECPFHTEKTGSFVVYEDQNTYHCYGCGENGDSISFIQKQQNLEFIEAIRFLLRR